MTAGSEAAILTPERALDRRALGALAGAIRSQLETTVGPGATVGIWVGDAIDFAACAMAVMSAGAHGYIVLPDATPDRVVELGAIEGASAVLCDEARSVRLAGRQRPCGPGLALVESGPSIPVRADGEGGLHFFTSGTDGRPKGVVRTKTSLAMEEATVGPHLGMASGCKVLCAVPIMHGYGYTAGVFAPMSLGGASIIAQPRLAASLAKLIREHQPDVVVAVPAQYAAWAALRESYEGPMPRLWLCGGAPLPSAVRERFKAAWGAVIAEQYGMTETGAVSVDLDGTQTLGRPYPGVRVTVDDAGMPGQPGELVVDAPYGPCGYVGDRAEDRFTPAGFRSNDNGWFDGEGRLHLVGRRGNQLNVRGRQVDPAEVERALWGLGGVHDVAVVGVDRAEGDQWVAAFVVCSDILTDEELHAATARLEGFKRPQRVIRLPAIPKNATGKTDVVALRTLSLPPH